MNLEKHYAALWEKSLCKFRQGEFDYDVMIDDPSDNRMGLTLLIRPDLPTREKIGQLLGSLKALEPAQYYYPNSDIHVTVLSIISCYAGFRLNHIKAEDYIALIKEALNDMPSFEITLKGITASNAGIMVQGFPSNNQLNEIRNKIRTKFKHSELQQSLDQRYLLKTAHSTILRFKAPLQNKRLFLDELLKHRETALGTFEVKNIDLVYGDWYQRKSRVKHLHTFWLG